MPNNNLDPTDRKRLEEWYRKYHTLLCEFLRYKNKKVKYKLAKGEISDIATDVLFLLLNKFKGKKFQYKGESSLKSWLKKAAHFSLTNYLKKQKGTIVDFGSYEEFFSQPETTDSIEQTENDCYKEQVIKCIYEFINKQSAGDKLLLELYYYRSTNVKVKQIAEIMGHKESWVKGRSFQLRKKLKEHLAKNGFEEEWKIFENF